MVKTKVNKEKKEIRSLDSMSMWKTERKFSNFAIPILIALILIAMVGLGWYAMQNVNSSTDINDLKQKIDGMEKSFKLETDDLKDQVTSLQKDLDEKVKAEEEQKALEEAENSKGFIEGSLSYPSSYIPQNMKICAQNLKTKKEYCTDKQIYDKKYMYNVGYKIEVAAGEYNVYSSVPDRSEEKAYYSEFVTCGSSTNCTSHTPIKVVVAKDQTVDEVDPIDWYNK